MQIRWFTLCIKCPPKFTESLLFKRLWQWRQHQQGWGQREFQMCFCMWLSNQPLRQWSSVYLVLASGRDLAIATGASLRWDGEWMGWCIFKKTKLCSTSSEGTPLPMACWEASNLRAFSGSYPSWRQSSAMKSLVVWCVYIGDAGTMRGSRTGSFWWNWGGGLKRSFSEMAESEKRNIPKNLLEGRKTYFQTVKMEWCTPRSPVYSYIIDFPAGYTCNGHQWTMLALLSEIGFWI